MTKQEFLKNVQEEVNRIQDIRDVELRVAAEEALRSKIIEESEFYNVFAQYMIDTGIGECWSWDKSLLEAEKIYGKLPDDYVPTAS